MGFMNNLKQIYVIFNMCNIINFCQCEKTPKYSDVLKMV